MQVVKASDGQSAFQVVMSSCCSDKWSMKDHLRIGGTKSLISVVFTVKEDAIWDGVVCLCGKEPDFFFFTP